MKKMNGEMNGGFYPLVIHRQLDIRRDIAGVGYFVGYSAVGLDGEIFFCCHKIYSFNNFPASPPLISISALCQWTGIRLRSSLEQRTHVDVMRSFGKRSVKCFTMVRKILCTNDRTSMDPSLSGNGALY